MSKNTKTDSDKMPERPELPGDIEADEPIIDVYYSEENAEEVKEDFKDKVIDREP